MLGKDEPKELTRFRSAARAVQATCRLQDRINSRIARLVDAEPSPRVASGVFDVLETTH